MLIYCFAGQLPCVSACFVHCWKKSGAWNPLCGSISFPRCCENSPVARAGKLTFLVSVVQEKKSSWRANRHRRRSERCSNWTHAWGNQMSNHMTLHPCWHWLDLEFEPQSITQVQQLLAIGNESHNSGSKWFPIEPSASTEPFHLHGTTAWHAWGPSVPSHCWPNSINKIKYPVFCFVDVPLRINAMLSQPVL